MKALVICYNEKVLTILNTQFKDKSNQEVLEYLTEKDNEVFVFGEGCVYLTIERLLEISNKLSESFSLGSFEEVLAFLYDGSLITSIVDVAITGFISEGVRTFVIKESTLDYSTLLIRVVVGIEDSDKKLVKGYLKELAEELEVEYADGVVKYVGKELKNLHNNNLAFSPFGDGTYWVLIFGSSVV